MAHSGSTVDGDAPRPGPEQTTEAVGRLRFVHRPGVGPACRTLLDELRRTHVNGGALLATFDVEGDPTSAWFSSRGRFDELGFFDVLLGSPELRDALPELVAGRDASVRPDFTMQFAGAFLVAGWLAGVLSIGGAYEKFRGTAPEALTIANSAADEVLQGRHRDFAIYSTSAPWSSWFHGVAWDSTHLAIDTVSKRVTLLAITDTD